MFNRSVICAHVPWPYFLCFYFCSIRKYLKQSNVVNAEYTPVLTQGNVIYLNFPPQSFWSYQEAVNYFLFAGELIDFNTAQLNYSDFTVCKIPVELLWAEMDIKLHKQYSLGPFTRTAPRAFQI